MSTPGSPRSRQNRPLQVGPFKPSLAQTLADDYAAWVLPDSESERAAFLAEHGADVTGGRSRRAAPVWTRR